MVQRTRRHSRCRWLWIPLLALLTLATAAPSGFAQIQLPGETPSLPPVQSPSLPAPPPLPPVESPSLPAVPSLPAPTAPLPTPQLPAPGLPTSPAPTVLPEGGGTVGGVVE